MEMQLLTEFPLKMTIIDEAIAKKVILLQIWHTFGPSLVQILSKIAKFERISEFSNIYHENTHTDRVSSQNDYDWRSYC